MGNRPDERLGLVKLGIRYETEYSYDEPVGFSPHDVRLFPEGWTFRRVRRLDFSTRPKATVRFSQDVFDNTVASCYFPERSQELQLQLAIDLDLEERDPFHFLLENYAVDLPFVLMSRLLEPVLEPYRTRRSNGELKVASWSAPNEETPRSTVSTLVELNQTIHECIGYERREEGVAREPEETLRIGRGACRDVAVLLAEILRGHGTGGATRRADICAKVMPSEAARRRFVARVDGSFFARRRLGGPGRDQRNFLQSQFHYRGSGIDAGRHHADQRRVFSQDTNSCTDDEPARVDQFVIPRLQLRGVKCIRYATGVILSASEGTSRCLLKDCEVPRIALGMTISDMASMKFSHVHAR